MGNGLHRQHSTHAAAICTLILLTLPFLMPLVLQGESAGLGQTALGRQPLYIIRETVETNGTWTNVLWQNGPTILAERHQLLQSDTDPTFSYGVRGLTLWTGKGSAQDSTEVVVQIEALVTGANGTATVDASKGFLGRMKIDVSVWNLPRNSFTELAPFPLDTKDPELTVDLDLTHLYNYPSGNVGIQDAVPGISKAVFADYFTWYGNPSGPSSQWSHWGAPVGKGITNTTIVNTTDYPLLGPYDSGDENVVLSQLAMAKYAGIDGFVVSWWRNDQNFTDNHIGTILKAANQVGMKIVLDLDGIYTRHVSPGDIAGDIIYLTKAYASDTAYLKSSGRPVVFVYSPEMGLNETLTPSFWEQVRIQVDAQVGRVVLIGGTFNLAFVHVFDGFWTYTDVYAIKGGNVEQYYATAKQTTAYGLESDISTNDAFATAFAGGQVNVDRKFFFYTVTPGHDNTDVANPGIMVDRTNGTLYSSQWSSAIRQNASAVIVSSWNEWHEGAEIEPSLQNGFTYIGLTRKFSQEYKNVVLPSLDPRFSATVETTSSTTSQELRIAISATTNTPALMTKVELKSAEVTNPAVSGDFVAYVNGASSTGALVQVPYVHPTNKSVVRVQFQLTGKATIFSLHVVSYDPSGYSYDLFDGKGSINSSSVTVDSTSVRCGSSTVLIGTTMQCSAKVSGTSPTGIVSWSQTGVGSVSVVPSSCILVTGGCQTTIRGTSLGDLEIRAYYIGDSQNPAGVGTIGIAVNSVSASCTPHLFVVGNTASCKAFVRGASPSGSVKWSTESIGKFSSPICILSHGACSVKFTPAVEAPAGRVVASYSGDDKNPKSAGTAIIVIGRRASSVVIFCKPILLTEGGQTTCTSIVKGYLPTGRVTWLQDGVGNSVLFSTNKCTLVSDRCSVVLTGTLSEKVTIRAIYGGDQNNAGSSRTRNLIVK